MIVGQLEIELATNIARLSVNMREAQGVIDQATGAMARAAGLAKMALGAMAGVLSIGAFAGFIKGAADASAGLHDMSIQTGASVASLMAFQSVAATTDTTIEDIGGAMNRFAKSMAGADEESKGIGRAVQSIGLDFNALKAMAPEQQMLTIARALDRLENGALKASVAMTFYGKQGAAMLPYLGDLAAQSGDVTAMLTAQEIATQKAAAALADDFGDNLAKINKLGNDWARDLSNGMMPALVAVTGEILKAAEGAGGFAAALRKISADGTVAAWTTDLIDGIKKVIAVIEPAAKIAAVYFGLFVAAPAAIAATVAAMTPLIHAMAVYAMNVAIGQANTIGFNTVLFGTSVNAQLAAGSLTKLGLAANVLFAGFAGWQIGAYLEEQFVSVKVFAEVLTGAVLEMWEHIKLGSKLALDAMTIMWRTTFSGLTNSLAPMYEGIATGLRKIGFDEKAGQIEDFAKRVRAAGDAQGTFASRTAEARGEHERNITAIRMVTQSHVDAIVVADQVSEATRGTGVAAAAATTSITQLSDEQKKAAETADSFIEAQKIERAEIGKTQAQIKQMAAERAAAAAPLARQKKEILELAEAIARESESWALVEKAREAAQQADNAHYEAMRAGTAAIDDRIKQMQREVDMHGLTASAAIDAERAKLEAKLAAGPATYAELAALDAQIEKLGTLAELTRNKEGLDASKKAADQIVEDQKRVWGDLERTAHDTFISIFDSGKSAFDRLKDALKNGLYELLYQMTVKKWIINVSTSTEGAGIASALSGSGGSGGGIGSAMSLINTGKSIYSAFTGGIASTLGGWASSAGSMFGSSAVSSFGAGLSAAGGNSGMAAMYASAQTSGNVAAGASMGMSAGTYAIPIAGWIAAGMALSNNLYKSGWQADNGSMNTLGNVVSSGSKILDSALRGIGLSKSTANIFSGMSTYVKLFGRKNPEVETQGIQGSIGAGGFDGSSYANILEKGGWFRSDKRYTQTAALGAEQDAGLDTTIKAMMDAAKGFASTLGIEASVIEGYNKTIKLQLGADEAKNQEAITKLFGEVGDELSLRLAPSLTSFALAGETASATLQRLVVNYATVDEALTAIGMTMGAVGVTSLGARERLIEAAGGLEAFAANTAGFQQNFLSEAERNAPVLKAVTEQLAALSLAGVDTRDEFKSVVLGLDLTTEAGAKQYGELMKMQAAFAQLYPVLEATVSVVDEAAVKLAETNKGFQDQINEILRGRMSATELRGADTAGMDPTTVALYDRLAALRLEDEALAKAADRSREVADEAKALQDQYDQLTMTRERLLKKERDAIDPANVARWDEIKAIEAHKAAAEATTQAIKAASESAMSFARTFGDAVMSAMTRAEQSAKAIRDFSASLNLGSLSALDPDARYREAKKLYESADPADTQAAQAFLQASKDRGADSFYYERDFAAVQSKLVRGAASLDAYADRLPAFYASLSEPAPLFTRTAPEPVVQYGGMSKSSAQQADMSRVEAKVDKLIEKLGGTMEVVASSTSALAEQFDRVTAGGQGMAVAT